MSFEALGLRAELLRAIANEGYTTPTPVQQQAIPLVLAGKDVMAAAQTGTGKTAAFTLPILHRLAESPAAGGRRPVRALILTPTRELAAQVGESVAAYGRLLSLRSTVVYGGVSILPQAQRLHNGVDVLTATPGRLLDLVNQKAVKLNELEVLVLDEADRMLDMGFIHDIRKVMALLPKERQTLLFSATFSDEIQTLANGILNHPQLVEVAPRNTAAETVDQRVVMCDKSSKRALLSFLIGDRNWQQVLVFTRTKHGANRLAEQLEKDGLHTAALHGNKSQGARTRALAEFKQGKIRVLVATDIAARGIDIDLLPHVVNYELPNIPEDYVHRIGRTGRATNVGEAWSLVCGEEKRFLSDIEKLLRTTLRREKIPGFEPDPNAPSSSPDERDEGRRGQQRRGGRGQQGRDRGLSPQSEQPLRKKPKDRRGGQGQGQGKGGQGHGKGTQWMPGSGGHAPLPDKEVNGNVAGKDTHNLPRLGAVPMPPSRGRRPAQRQNQGQAPAGQRNDRRPRRGNNDGRGRPR